MNSTILVLEHVLAFEKLDRPFRELEAWCATSGSAHVKIEKAPLPSARVDRVGERVVPSGTAHQLMLVRRVAISVGKRCNPGEKLAQEWIKGRGILTSPVRL